MKHIKYFETTKLHKKYLVQEMHQVFTLFVVYENIKELIGNRLMLRQVYSLTRDGVLTQKDHEPTFTYNIGDVDWVYQSDNIDDVLDMLQATIDKKKYNL